MKRLLKLVSALGLVLTVGPAFLVAAGVLTWKTHAVWMAVGTLLWFGTAPFWMRREAEG